MGEQEQKELYFYTKNQFAEDLQRISPSCVAPLIAVRQVVLKAMDDYAKNYSTVGYNTYSSQDYHKVSYKLFDEVMERKE